MNELNTISKISDWEKRAEQYLIEENYSAAAKLYEEAIEQEEDTEEAMDSMERKYWEGVTETYAELYALTYEIAFAKGALNGNA